MYDTLSKLPIPQEIRKIFYDLLANRYIGNKAVESEELKEKVHQQRKLAERGGISINSNIIALIAKYQREKLFSQRNFVLSDFNKYDKAIVVIRYLVLETVMLQKINVMMSLNSFTVPK